MCVYLGQGNDLGVHRKPVVHCECVCASVSVCVWVCFENQYLKAFFLKSHVHTYKSAMHTQKRLAHDQKSPSKRALHSIQRALYTPIRPLYSLRRVLPRLTSALHNLKRAHRTIKRALYTLQRVYPVHPRQSRVDTPKSPICIGTQKRGMHQKGMFFFKIFFHQDNSDDIHCRESSICTSTPKTGVFPKEIVFCSKTQW